MARQIKTGMGKGGGCYIHRGISRQRLHLRRQHSCMDYNELVI